MSSLHFKDTFIRTIPNTNAYLMSLKRRNQQQSEKTVFGCFSYAQESLQASTKSPIFSTGRLDEIYTQLDLERTCSSE